MFNKWNFNKNYLPEVAVIKYLKLEIFLQELLIMEDVLKDVPEDVLQYIKKRYDEYKATAKEPYLDFETYFFKVYDLAIDVVGLKNKKELIEEDIEILENELEEFNSKIAEAEAEELLTDFSKVYDIIINDSSLNHDEKLDKLKAYYFTSVRNVAKEIKFLNNLNSLIKEQDSEGFNDVLLIDFHEYIKQFYD